MRRLVTAWALATLTYVLLAVAVLAVVVGVVDGMVVDGAGDGWWLALPMALVPGVPAALVGVATAERGQQASPSARRGVVAVCVPAALVAAWNLVLVLSAPKASALTWVLTVVVPPLTLLAAGAAAGVLLRSRRSRTAHPSYVGPA